MRVAVTGAAGFIGSHVVELLVAEGHEVVGIDAFIGESYPSEIKQRNMESLSMLPGLEWAPLDLRIDDLAEPFAGVEVIVHLAAMPGLVQSWTDFELYMSCNFQAVNRLAEAAVAAGVRRVVYASTSSVYGALASGTPDQVVRPVSPYGVTKLAAEHILNAFKEVYGLEVTVLRLFSVYGPRQRPDMAYYRFIERIARRERIEIYGDGSQSRTNTYVLDAARAVAKAVAVEESDLTIDVSGSESFTLLQALSIVGEILGEIPRIDFLPRRQGDQISTRGDLSGARRLLGYEPLVGLRSGLESQVRWQTRVSSV